MATTRPETILGDTALCVNPNDPRYASLPADARVIVPLVNRSIPVIRDEYVDIELIGALKVTPAHDVNDYMLGEKYGLETIDIFNDDGTINDKVGMYVGMDRFDVRKQIEKDLAAAGLLEKTEEYTNNVGYSERTRRGHRAEALDAVVPLDGGAGPARDQSRRWRMRSASCPKNTRTPTVTGWKTSRTGASRASCGGDSAFRPTTCPRAGTSWPRRPKRRSQRRVRKPATTRCSRATCVRTRMCWTPGSRRGSGRFRSSTASAIRTIRK